MYIISKLNIIYKINFLKNTASYFCLVLLSFCCGFTCKALISSFQDITLRNKQSNTTTIKFHSTNNHALFQLKNNGKKPALTKTQTSSSTSSPWSNAFNFKKHWGTTVDPRTGTLTAYVKAGSMISNLDRGPNINLQVSYNSNSRADPDQLGVGWSWNLTHFNPVNNQLSTSQGQTFNLERIKDGVWRPHYHKLHDIQIDGSKNKYFTITYNNGLREILNHNGFETRLEQQDGRGVTFDYVAGTHLLSTIRDDLGHKITLTQQEGFITVTSYDADGKPVNIMLNHFNNELRNIILPEESRQTSPNIHMEYYGHLLNQVIYPSGLKKSITYNCTSAMAVALPYDNQRHLCVVTRESTDPGASQPEMVTRYSYDQSSANEHNYLGFNSGLNKLISSSQDTLFEAPVEYTYTTMQDNGITTQLRTYNKYHLLISARLISKRTGHLLSAVNNFYCCTDKNDGCAHTRFSDLPVTYSLPLKMVTKIWGENSGAPAVETVENSYDVQGRLIKTKDAYGREQITSYCPASGNTACPAEPDGWSLSTQVQSVTMKPADQPSKSSILPLTTHYYYQKESNLKGNGYILVLTKKVVHSGHQQITTMREYNNNKKDIFQYGLLKTTVLTGSVSSDKTLNNITTDYHYILNKSRTTKTTYTAVKISTSQFKRSPAVTSSMFTNQVLEVADPANKSILRYHYDHQGRVIQIDSGVGTAFAVSKHYHYTVSPNQLQLIMTASNGLQNKILFDGAGRPLILFREAISASGTAQPGKWLPVKSITYDNYGRVAAKKTYYTDALGNIQNLTTTFTYDDLGRVLREHLPDQETVVKVYDDPDRCTVNFSYDSKGNSSVIAVTYNNLLDKPVKQILLPANFVTSHFGTASTLCKTNYTQPNIITSSVVYDGLGRVIKSVDPMGRIVTKDYDALGHVIYITDPAGDKIHNIYNLVGQLVQQWTIPANEDKQSLPQYLLASAQYNAAGELLWKAGEDKKKTMYTYTLNGEIKTITTPAGHIISWQYNLIGLPVSETLDTKPIVHLSYDPITALLTTKTDITGITTWTYSDDNKTQQLRHIGANGYPDYYFHWQYDRNRRIISVTDLLGNKRLTLYDKLNRIVKISYQQHTNGAIEDISKITYDSFSRIVAAVYGSNMARYIHYNNYGQTKNVDDLLVRKHLSEWKYDYDKAGNIISLMHSTGENHQQQATLHYQYDELNNLTTMTCSGSSGLPLCPRDTALRDSNLQQAPIITSQHYFFNHLNRMKQVKEALQDSQGKETLSKVVNYGYGDQQAPLRLQQISTAWNGQILQIDKFIYDTVGNMLIDSTGHHMTYNAFNQITQVISPEGKQTHYDYDGNSREVKEKTTSGNVRTLIYVAKTLSGEIISNSHQETHTISYLGTAKAIDGTIQDYYEKNYKGDITGVLDKTTTGTYKLSYYNIYSPYGMVWHTHSTSSLPWYQQTLAGFNGEQTDPSTGWQFLGAGHRTYNPGQRYFVSEDPAGDGYAFGSNNPVMNTDPDGNLPKWIGSAMHILSYAGTLGLVALHKQWANITSIALMTALGASALGISACFAGGITPLIATSVALTASAGTLAITSAAIPANRGLNIASTCAGLLAMAADISTAGITALSRTSKLFSEVKALDTIDAMEAIREPTYSIDAVKFNYTGAMSSAEISVNETAQNRSTFDILSEALSDFIQQKAGINRLSISDSNEFITAWYKIVNSGLNIKNHLKELFLIFVNLRVRNLYAMDLAELAHYIDLKNRYVLTAGIQNDINRMDQCIVYNNLRPINEFISNVYYNSRTIGFTLLPSEHYQYFTFIHKTLRAGRWYVISLDENGNKVDEFYSSNNIVDLTNNRDGYFYL